MGSVGNPETWPFGNNIRDCSQGICRIYCPQWCFPPPPPSTFPLQTRDPSDPNVSPLVIAIIGILAAAFLLVTYYTVASKYCATSRTAPGRHPAASPPPSRAGDAGGGGVEESLIKSMMVCRYRKGEGVMGITDCSVCLNEFQQDESLRLLPKCCHAFHVRCIDTWLQTHSNCPLCRAHILPLYPLPPPAPSEDWRRSNDHACDVRVEEQLKQGAPASSVGDGREQSRGEGEVSLERVERGEGSSMSTPGGGGEKMSKSMATAGPASTSSVEGLLGLFFHERWMIQLDGSFCGVW